MHVRRLVVQTSMPTFPRENSYRGAAELLFNHRNRGRIYVDNKMMVAYKQVSTPVQLDNIFYKGNKAKFSLSPTACPIVDCHKIVNGKRANEICRIRSRVKQMCTKGR